MTRRFFLKQVALGTAKWSFGAKPKPSALHSLTLLHSSESASQWLPLAEDYPVYAGYGGYAARFRFIEHTRAAGNPLLLLDSGNFIAGSKLADCFDGKVEMDALEKMGYDAVCLGEREADIGIDKLQKLLRHSRIPVISSNAYDSAFQDLLLPHLILKKGHFKIGIMGINRENSFLKIKNNPITAANDKAKELAERYHCDIVICLSRLGQTHQDETNDFLLAANSEHIHLIAGGENPARNPHPTIYRNRRGKEICILGSPKWGSHMNALAYKISEAKTIFLSNAHTVVIGK